MTLMAQLTELENRREYQPNPQNNTRDLTKCQNCHKMMTQILTTDVVDYLWPIGDADNQRPADVGAYLPLFDHELVPFDM